MVRRTLPAACLVACCAGLATAQPSAEDLGVLSTGTTTRSATLAAQEIKWYKFTVPAIGGGVYLDINTGGTILDTEAGLYRADGSRVANSDDEGPDAHALLSFGSPCPARTIGNGNLGSGQGGDLPPGDYYLAVGDFNMTFNAAGWSVVADGVDAGDVTVTLTIGDASENVTPPASAIDLGEISAENQGLLATGVPIGPAEVKWFTFTIAAPTDASQGVYLDIDTRGSLIASTFGPDDTLMGIYNQAGGLRAEDDDDGDGRTSQLSFGSTVARPVVGNGVAPAGQDGALSSGRYYVAVMGYRFSSDFLPCGFSATSGNANSGTVEFYASTNLPSGSNPCPDVDFNQDGGLDVADIAAFFDAFTGADPAPLLDPDVNQDGGIDVADIDAFFTAFAGGPC